MRLFFAAIAFWTAGVGLVVTLIKIIGKSALTVQVKWLPELDTENGLNGDRRKDREKFGSPFASGVSRVVEAEANQEKFGL